MIENIRYSTTDIGKIYFWTATINSWQNLLSDNLKKDVIIDSLKKLSDKKLITVYAFVIMPNHIHLIFRQNGLNGRETPKGSFLKFTAHSFLKLLKAEGKSNLYEVDATNKKHEIWQRDSMGIEIFTRKFAKQKLDYIHVNPVKGKWLLAKDDISYYYSSAKYYETGIDDFGFLNNIYTVFDGD